MKTYSMPNSTSPISSGPISLAVINSRNREASMTPLIRLEDAFRRSSSYSNPTYENKASIRDPAAVQEYGKAMSIGSPDYPKILEERAKGFKEVPGAQESAARYSMAIPLAEQNRDIILTSAGTIDNRLQGSKKTGPNGKMYQDYFFAYGGKLYIMPRQIRIEASEYFEKMREASRRIRPDLNKKMARETYDVSVMELGSEFEITHVGKLTGIKYSVVMPKLPYNGDAKRSNLFFPPTQMERAA